MGNWIINFSSISDTAYRIVIGGREGNDVTLTGGAVPIIIKEENSKEIYKTARRQTGYIRFFDPNRAEIGSILPKKATSRPIDLWRGTTLLFRGYIQPSNFGYDRYGLNDEYELPIQCLLSTLDSIAVPTTWPRLVSNTVTRVGIDKSQRIIDAMVILSNSLATPYADGVDEDDHTIYSLADGFFNAIILPEWMARTASGTDDFIAEKRINYSIFTELEDDYTEIGGMTMFKAIQKICEAFGLTARQICLENGKVGLSFICSDDITNESATQAYRFNIIEGEVSAGKTAMGRASMGDFSSFNYRNNNQKVEMVEGVNRVEITPRDTPLGDMLSGETKEVLNMYPGGAQIGYDYLTGNFMTTELNTSTYMRYIKETADDLAVVNDDCTIHTYNVSSDSRVLAKIEIEDNGTNIDDVDQKEDYDFTSYILLNPDFTDYLHDGLTHNNIRHPEIFRMTSHQTFKLFDCILELKIASEIRDYVSVHWKDEYGFNHPTSGEPDVYKLTQHAKITLWFSLRVADMYYGVADPTKDFYTSVPVYGWYNYPTWFRHESDANGVWPNDHTLDDEWEPFKGMKIPVPASGLPSGKIELMILRMENAGVISPTIYPGKADKPFFDLINNSNRMPLIITELSLREVKRAQYFMEKRQKFVTINDGVGEGEKSLSPIIRNMGNTKLASMEGLANADFSPCFKLKLNGQEFDMSDRLSKKIAASYNETRNFVTITRDTYLQNAPFRSVATDGTKNYVCIARQTTPSEETDKITFLELKE